MIESPVKPAPLSSRRASAPPPDPTTRALDAPPVAGLVHDRACAECGSPLHADQAACLSCGSMVEETEGRVGLRRAAFSSATALLVLGIAVGAAVAGLPNGKHIGNAPIAQVFGTKAIPPATVTSPPASTTPLPRATAGVTPRRRSTTLPRTPPRRLCRQQLDRHGLVRHNDLGRVEPQDEDPSQEDDQAAEEEGAVAVRHKALSRVR